MQKGRETSTLSETEAEAVAQFYRDHGYAIIKGFVNGQDLDDMRREAAAVYAEGLKHPMTYYNGNLAFEILPEKHFGKRYVQHAYWFSWINEWFAKHRRSERMRALLRPIIGDEVKQLVEQLHWKPPGAGKTGYRFHQDYRFRPNPEQYQDIVGNSVNIGIAIDPCKTENGCLRIFPDSHKLGYLGLADDGDGTIMNGLSTDEELIQKGLNPKDMLYVELEPGDAVIWSLLTVHGSLPNKSDRDRAFAISSYVRAEASPNRGEWVFRGGESVPLGDVPQPCKDSANLNRPPGGVYEDSEWYLND
ncbi:MAG: phytanoyl-CoA dioxygenase family protein [Alphaproteobacteria bacterium]|nr:phytanoyl-CoA dioxygenase family protein [Alphaproteobacteria bacterium]